MDRKSGSIYKRMTEDELQEAFAALPAMQQQMPKAHTWPRYLWDIRKHVEKQDPAAFLTWSTLHATMFVGNGAGFTEHEVEALKSDGWHRWKLAITETDIGQPPRMDEDLEFTSGNMIHQAYHLLQFEKAADKWVHELDRIVEFGGGYGAMVAICRRLGFKGEYVIYDNDEMGLIQQYYLSNLGYEAEFRLTTDDEFANPGDADLLIASYSLSEVSDELRSAWMELPDFQHYLIVHQDKYWDLDLNEEFKGIISRRPDREWAVIDSPIRGHSYVIGLPLD